MNFFKLKLKTVPALIAILIGGFTARAQAPDTLQVQLNDSTSVRTLSSDKFLISDTVIPKGAIVEVPVQSFKNAATLPYWNGASEQKMPFVKGVRLISAPGFSAAEIKSINDWNQTAGVFISKPVLGNAIVVPPTNGPRTAPSTSTYTVQKPTEVFRDDGPDQDPVYTDKRNTIDKPTAEGVVEQIQQGNRAAHGAGAAPQFCPGCEKNLMSKIIEQGVPQKALDEAIAEQGKNPKGLIHNKRFITIVDFTKMSGQKRMFVIDMQTGSVEKLYTSNGRGSETKRKNLASSFSNQPGSYKTPAGFHVTGFADAKGIHTTPGIHHTGHHPQSLLLIGLEARNSNSASRAILIHDANYATDAFAQSQSRIGRSEGCLAIDPKKLKEVLGKIQGGSLVYNYTGE